MVEEKPPLTFSLFNLVVFLILKNTSEPSVATSLMFRVLGSDSEVVESRQLQQYEREDQSFTHLLRAWVLPQLQELLVGFRRRTLFWVSSGADEKK